MLYMYVWVCSYILTIIKIDTYILHVQYKDIFALVVDKRIRCIYLFILTI